MQARAEICGCSRHNDARNDLTARAPPLSLRAAVVIVIIAVSWLLRQLGLPKIRARLHDGWWVLEVFMAMTVFAALIYSGFAFITTR